MWCYSSRFIAVAFHTFCTDNPPPLPPCPSHTHKLTIWATFRKQNNRDCAWKHQIAPFKWHPQNPCSSYFRIAQEHLQASNQFMLFFCLNRWKTHFRLPGMTFTCAISLLGFRVSSAWHFFGCHGLFSYWVSRIQVCGSWVKSVAPFVWGRCSCSIKDAWTVSKQHLKYL